VYNDLAIIQTAHFHYVKSDYVKTAEPDSE